MSVVPDISVKTIIPWVILTSLVSYVSVLSYYDGHRTPPEPAFNFYAQTQVTIHLHGADTMDVQAYGSYNNIFEGDEQTIMATAPNDSTWNLQFEINSPRPATLYVNDEAFQVCLSLDSGLDVDIFMNPDTLEIDTTIYVGAMANVCDYYAAKSKRFLGNQLAEFRNTRMSESPAQHAHWLDSMATQELAFLLTNATPFSLPDWFITFEKSEILYRKAYLKRVSYKEGAPFEGYYDEIPLMDQGAVFSYAYYLYLHTYFRQEFPNSQDAGMAVADSTLWGEPHDVYVTRTLLQMWADDKKAEAKEIYQRYNGRFFRKKYPRFLRIRMELDTK